MSGWGLQNRRRFGGDENVLDVHCVGVGVTGWKERVSGTEETCGGVWLL